MIMSFTLKNLLIEEYVVLWVLAKLKPCIYLNMIRVKVQDLSLTGSVRTDDGIIMMDNNSFFGFEAQLDGFQVF